MAGRDPATIEIAPALQRWAAFGWQQQSGRLTSHWRAILDADPLLVDAVMVIELVFGGRFGGATRVRIATVPVRSLSTLTGTRYDALPKLIEEPDVQHSYQLGVGSSAARSVALSVDPEYLNPITLIKNGIPLCGVAEVSLEHISARGGEANHDRRLVLIRGDIDGSVRFGGKSGRNRELMEVEIVDPRATANTRLPPWIIDADRISTVHPSTVGARVPLVYNAFTGIPAQRITTTLTGSNKFLFAHGIGFTVVTVWVNGIVKASGDPTYGWALLDSIDDHGEPYSSIHFTNGGTIWSDSDAVHVSVTNGDALNMIEVIRKVLVDHSAIGLAGINESLFSETEARLPVQVDPEVVINGASGASATNVLEWVEQGYLAMLPMVSMVWEGGGYGPILTDHRLAPTAEWTVGSLPLFDRLSLVEETSKDQIRNDFVFRYDYNALEDIYEKVVVRNRENSDVCRYSQDLFGRSDASPIEAPYVDDDSVADYVVDWMVEHQSLPSYLVQYEGAASILLTHRRGDTVYLTDAEFEWSLERATIQDITYHRGRVVVMLRVWIRFMDLGGAALSV